MYYLWIFQMYYLLKILLLTGAAELPQWKFQNKNKTKNEIQIEKKKKKKSYPYELRCSHKRHIMSPWDQRQGVTLSSFLRRWGNWGLELTEVWWGGARFQMQVFWLWFLNAFHWISAAFYLSRKAAAICHAPWQFVRASFVSIVRKLITLTWEQWSSEAQGYGKSKDGDLFQFFRSINRIKYEWQDCNHYICRV